LLPITLIFGTFWSIVFTGRHFIQLTSSSNDKHMTLTFDSVTSDHGRCLSVGGSDVRSTASQQCVPATSHSGSMNTSPTTATTTSTTTTAVAAAAADDDALNVTMWSSLDVQNWLHDNDLDCLTDRYLLVVVVR